MNEAVVKKGHWSIWLVGIFSLLWAAGGCANFATQMMMGAELYPKLSEGQLALIKDRPMWSTIAFGVAMITALLGSLMLLFKKSASLTLFFISLFAVAIVMIHGAMVAATGVAFSGSEIVMFFIGQSLLSILLVAYAKFAIGRGWLR